MQYDPTVKKVPADTVPYGREVSNNGKYVYAAYDGEQYVCCGATVAEVKRKYRVLETQWRYDKQSKELMEHLSHQKSNGKDEDQKC